MDATIVVGVVGVAATAVTAWIGFWNARKTTEQAIAAGAANTRATLAAAREDRLWERRCAAYEETLGLLLYLHSKRRNELNGYRWYKDSEQKVEAFYGAYEAPGFFESRARLTAYASDGVIDASHAADKADEEVQARRAQLEELREQIRTAQANGTPQSAPDGETVREAGRQVNSALEEAELADGELIEVVRAELRSAPGAAIAPPADLPAKRGKYLRRHQELHRQS